MAMVNKLFDFYVKIMIVIFPYIVIFPVILYPRTALLYSHPVFQLNPTKNICDARTVVGIQTTSCTMLRAQVHKIEFLTKIVFCPFRVDKTFSRARSLW